VGVVGAALRGFGKALSKKGSGKAIKSVPIAKRLTERRKDTESLFKTRQDAGAKPIKGMSKAVSDVAAANTKYDKAVAASKKKFKSQKRKVIGGASAGVVGVVGAHGAAKKKFPKYKKVMESDVVIKDGKLGLRPGKKK
tara:strand:+ start:295 stop:711 length:417 start_codon:yes stop_codon:yes gene_type:complete